MHQYAIQSNYDMAADKIGSGAWTVDAGSGHVIGTKGQPFKRTNNWGYIQIKFRHPEDWRKDVAVVAHRVIWESVHGPLPEHLHINHINGNKTDNRLSNLELVTPADNIRHAYATGLNVGIKGVENPNAKLTEEYVADIYRRARSGEQPLAIAVEYGISREVVSNIKNGWSWTEVTGAIKRVRRPRLAA